MNTLIKDAQGTPIDGSISDELRSAYLNYAMSVITSRALPDVRDGLKPVHRRILYAMDRNGYRSNAPYKKSARIVGDVMGKYHPHGDSAIYDSLVRMAQGFSLRVPLIDGQGNFGSLDGDPPAAMRYTEARMSRAAHEMTVDIDKNTVDFSATYDSSDYEPKVLPARFPALLVNGQSGIAVGMATNIPPHNPGEVIDACLHCLDHPAATADDLMEFVQGPDFPTGAIAMGKEGMREAYRTGKGKFKLVAKAEIVERKGGRHAIVISEIPYAENKAELVAHIAELASKNEIAGISTVRDESDRRDPVRIVVELSREADPNVVLNHLKGKTALVTTFSMNMVCLDEYGRPQTMSLNQMISTFVRFRKQVVYRRTAFDLEKSREALDKQIGLYAAVTRIDEVVRTIRASASPEEAKAALMALEFETAGGFLELLQGVDPDATFHGHFKLSEMQVLAILAMTLRALTGLEREKIRAKALELSAEIKGLNEILSNESVLNAVIKDEFDAVKVVIGKDRLTEIQAGAWESLDDDDLIPEADVVITLSHGGYVKRTPLEAYRSQARGGKGRAAMDTKEDDSVALSLVTTTHHRLVVFTKRGMAYFLKTYHLPEAPIGGRGRPMVNFVDLQPGDAVRTILALPNDPMSMNGKSMMFVTDFGTVRRSDALDFARINKSGKLAIRLEDEKGKPAGDLVGVYLASPEEDLCLFTGSGRSIRFQVEGLRIVGSRMSPGVRGVQLGAGDKVISACVLDHIEQKAGEEELDDAAQDDANSAKVLTVTERGYVKQTHHAAYRATSRGGKGFRGVKVSEKTGKLVSALPAKQEASLLLLTKSGKTIRMMVADLPVLGRATQGSRAVKLNDNDQVVYAAITES